MPADLHCHTNASDGLLSRQALLDVARMQGVTALAVTDHDTMQNSFDEETDGLRVIRGCELSAVVPETGRRIHILCYLPHDTAPLQPFFAFMQNERKKAGDEMLRRVAQRYPIVTAERVAQYSAPSGIVHKQDIMNVLMDFGVTKEMFGDLYKTLFGDGPESCLVRPGYPDMYTLLNEARRSGGVFAAAHPSVFKSMDAVVSLAKAGLIDAVEVHHPRNREEDKRVLLDLSREYGLLVTGGSDYHGGNSSGIVLPGAGQTDDENLERLFELSERKKYQ